MVPYRLNISFAVEAPVLTPWLDMVRGKLLPLLVAEGFTGYVFSRVVSVEAASHHTYSLLIDLGSMADYLRLTGPVWDQYAEVARPMFGDDVVWFTTLLKHVEDGMCHQNPKG